MQNLLNEFEEPDYIYVGFWSRFWALLIDGIILSAASFLLRSVLGEITNPVVTLLASLIPFLYNPIMEYHYGATVGKMALGIKIVNSELQRLTINNVIFRNLIYFSIQLVNIVVELYQFYNTSENNIGGFESLSDFFTPQVTMSIIFSVFVFVIYVVELIFLLTDEKHRSLHDRIGKTYVVRKTA